MPIAVARRWRDHGHSPDQEESYVRGFLTTDEDDQLYFDYVSWNSVVAVVGAADEAYPGYLDRLGRVIRRGLAHADVGVVEKYLWLYKHYISALDLFAEMPLEHGYRSQSPENCALIESLPRYQELADQAQGRLLVLPSGGLK